MINDLPVMVPGRSVCSMGRKRATSADATSLIEDLLLIFAAVIAGSAIGGAAQAWRGWTHHRGK